MNRATQKRDGEKKKKRKERKERKMIRFDDDANVETIATRDRRHAPGGELADEEEASVELRRKNVLKLSTTTDRRMTAEELRRD